MYVCTDRKVMATARSIVVGSLYYKTVFKI